MKTKTNTLNITLTGAILASALFSSVLQAEETTIAPESNGNFGITAKSGTLGLGVDLTYGITPKLNARLNVNGGKINYNETKDGVYYKGDIDALTAGGLLDYHPTGGGFRITAGLYNNNNEINLNATGEENSSVKIGDNSYDISNASLTTNISAKGISPYLGLGWGNAVNKEQKWNFSLDAGVLFQGSPKIKLKGKGTATELVTGLGVDLGTNALFQENILKEEDNLNGDVEDFKAYPVISVGASYRFY